MRTIACSLLLFTSFFAGCGESKVELVTEASPTEIPVSDSSEELESDWPRMYGPTEDSHSSETNIALVWGSAGPPEVWRETIGRGYSSPVIQGDRLILLHRMDDWELGTCYDTTTGKILWETVWPTAYHCVYEYSDGPYATPAIDGEDVFFIGAEARMCRVDLETGEELWVRDLKTDYQIETPDYGFGGTPAVWNDLIFINAGGKAENSGIVALDRETGETVWKATDEIGAYCVPLVRSISGKDFLFVLAQTNFVCLDPSTGDEYWRTPFGIKNSSQRVNAITPLFVDEDRVLITSGPGPGAKLIQIKDEEYEILWETRRGGIQPQYTNPWTYDGLVFAYSARKICDLVCVELETGETLWEWNREDTLRRSMTVAVGPAAISLTDEGHLFSLKPDREGPKLLQWCEEPVLKGPCFTQPILSRKKLYLRDERELVCLDLSPREPSVAQSP